MNLGHPKLYHIFRPTHLCSTDIYCNEAGLNLSKETESDSNSKETESFHPKSQLKTTNNSLSPKKSNSMSESSPFEKAHIEFMNNNEFFQPANADLGFLTIKTLNS